MTKGDGFGHELPYRGSSDDWITPKWIIDAFDNLADGSFFFLDPCACLTQPWPCARKAYTIEQDGLKQTWFGGSVWLNPPYGPHTSKWVRRLIDYNDGIALIFARVETKLWQNHIFPTANGYLFLRKRLSFYFPDGTVPKLSAPSALISWGNRCRNALIKLCESGTIPGAFFDPPFYTKQGD